MRLDVQTKTPIHAGYTTDHYAYTWDIGTTATFTRSNPVVILLTMGVLLTHLMQTVAERLRMTVRDTGERQNPFDQCLPRRF